MPSEKVATYDLKPEMSAPGIADEMIGALKAGKHQVVICNFANADMVGHTGRLDAAVAAVQTLDTCLGRILETLKLVGGRAVITADYGNAEQMWDDALEAPTRPTPPTRCRSSCTTRRMSDGRCVMGRSAMSRRRCWRCWGSRSRLR